ncbi:hypothetical protein EV294_1011174 [Paenibacillus sp. BK033]|nr:hypothetical protein EV294_1011174 [Paenibacillus sp. BK033]
MFVEHGVVFVVSRRIAWYASGNGREKGGHCAPGRAFPPHPSRAPWPCALRATPCLRNVRHDNKADCISFFKNGYQLILHGFGTDQLNDNFAFAVGSQS